jgi:hypothetical protein
LVKSIEAALFGSSHTQERTADEVDELIASCKSEDVTELLMRFGERLIKASDERVAALDAKATAVVAYSTAALAFLVTRQVPEHQLETLLFGLACGGALAACICGGLAIRSARNWRSVGEATWFPNDLSAVETADALGRWYLRAMHESYQRNHRIVDGKANEVVYAQAFMALTGVCLGVLLIVRIWP